MRVQLEFIAKDTMVAKEKKAVMQKEEAYAVNTGTGGN